MELLFGFIVCIEDDVEKNVLSVGVVEVRLEVLDDKLELVLWIGFSVLVSDDVLDLKVGLVDTRLKVEEVDVLDEKLELVVSDAKVAVVAAVCEAVVCEAVEELPLSVDVETDVSM